MANQSDILVQLSNALTTRTAAARDTTAAIRSPGARHLTGTIWRSDLLVASEQALPKRDKFDVVLPGGAAAEAQLAGRDAGTNIALLRLAQPVAAAADAGNASAEVGALALAFGADGSGGATARLGLLNFVGPQWHSHAGGRIDARIVLDIRLAPTEEGGPVFAVEGGRLGITTLGPRGRVLVIPATTIDAVVPLLLEHGRVARGWLGVAFQPVAVPDPLQAQAGQRSGLMVLTVVEGGPAAKAGVMPGDIVLAVDGAPATGVRGVVPRLGSDSVGRAADLRLLRGGAFVTVQAVIEARPSA
jgi:S1-C subfamily serine protease